MEIKQPIWVKTVYQRRVWKRYFIKDMLIFFT